MKSTRRAWPLLATLFALGAPTLGAADIDESLYASLLVHHTRDVPDLARVRVDYTALGSSQDWKELVAGLAKSDPADLGSRNERLAFWINAYNILAIDLVTKHYPIDGIKEIGSLFSPVWKKPAGRINGREYSLDEIEHKIVRPMGDPRTHVAVVCASLSCPALLREPWVASRLDAQLDAAMRNWLADTRKGARVDRDADTLDLSKIFDWFESDFEEAGGVVEFISKYLTDSDREWLSTRQNDVRVSYFDYDWALNDLATAR
jgi:hypothetical protein